MESFYIGDTVDDEYMLLVEGNALVNDGDNCNFNSSRNFRSNRSTAAPDVNADEVISDSSDNSSFLCNETHDSNNSLLVSHKRHKDNVALKKLLLISIICTLFMIAELIGGYIADSLAIMTDAAHLFSDVVGFLISLLSIWVGRKKPTSYMTYGYRRTEVLGAFLSILAIWVLAGIFCILAVRRLWNGDYDIDANVMLIVSSAGLIMNVIMAIVLHSSWWDNHSHGISMGHSHEENINVRAAAAHVLGDIIQSLGVLIVAIIMKASSSAQLLDPVCTILFSVIVVCVTARVAKDSILILLQCSPNDVNDIVVMLKGINGVSRVHNVRMWTLTPGHDVLTAHLIVDDFCDRDAVLNEATRTVKKRLNAVDVSFQLEKCDNV